MQTTSAPTKVGHYSPPSGSSGPDWRGLFVLSWSRVASTIAGMATPQVEESFEAELADIEVALVAEARDRDIRGRTHDARDVLVDLGVDVPDD